MKHPTTTAFLTLLLGIGSIAFSSAEAMGQVTTTVLRVDGDDGLAEPTGTPLPAQSWNDAFKYLQDALAFAEANDPSANNRFQIWVKARDGGAGYRPDQSAADESGTNSTAATFEMLENVAILGGFDGTESGSSQRDPEANETILTGVLSSNRAAHVVSVLEVVDTTAVLDGFTISGGDADTPSLTENGGGILVKPGSTGATPVFRNCVIRGNEARHGGGAACQVGGDAFFVECTFRANDANGVGGAFYVEGPGAPPNLINCQFIDNTAVDRGGAVAAARTDGVVIVNGLFVGNEATGTNSRGGAINNASAGVLVVNCTFTGNSADEGAAIHEIGTPSSEVRNSILWENDEGSDVYIETGASLTIEYCDVGTIAGDGTSSVSNNIDADPLFHDPSVGDYRLTCASPCLDAGDPDSEEIPADAFDIDGDSNTSEATPDLDRDNLRVQDFVVDMGSYEGPEAVSCDADVDGDGDVDIDDLLAVLAAWGECQSQQCPEDVTPICDGDNTVDINDLLFVLANWSGENQSCTGGPTDAPQSVQDCIDLYGEDTEECEACLEALELSGKG